MAIIVISHPSNFAAYLLAATILLYYEHQSRSLKIVIVEDFAANRGGIQDFKPWCGVNTLSNPRFQYGDFMVRELLNRLLLANRDLGIVPLDRINLSLTPRNGYNLDMPIHVQQEQITVSVAEQTNGIGVGNSSIVALVYHPSMVMNKLRFLIYNTGRVTFTSLNTRFGSLGVFAESLTGGTTFKEEIVVLDCSNSGKVSYSDNIDYLINSNSISVRSLEGNNSRRLPSYILWLPRIANKAHSQTLNDWKYGYRQYNKRIIEVVISNDNTNQIESRILSEVDIYCGLKLGDLALHVLEELTNSGMVDLISRKL
ncbi:predicted protein [Scheffersomyces stipitis CBS 6054]|uniref:Uncharacterized protein n=1 Tax=Scheffersomyces stipitis (strain ATCC 58785 / CBS 6054 / NBRC 10063 / NRRL Y-11545) TaxID=322104 RepID=A3LNQ8_PICST|nr:predicted protein [Scheffersomyces stipitis CBS 6054]ABN64369.2 predicted protein [Scheffersomyces stipitis CBS 6054]